MPSRLRPEGVGQLSPRLAVQPSRASAQLGPLRIRVERDDRAVDHLASPRRKEAAPIMNCVPGSRRWRARVAQKKRLPRNC